MGTDPGFDESAQAQRVAANDARFREANENISRIAEEASVERIPFLCECANMGCQALVRLTRVEYEHIRASGTTFLNAPGHVVAAEGWARLVEEHDEYDVVEKVGEAGEIAEELDPRA